MKTLHLVLVFSLLVAPLYGGNDKSTNPSSAKDITIGMIVVLCAGFAAIETYEWWKNRQSQPPKKPVSNNKTSASEKINIPAPTSVRPNIDLNKKYDHTVKSSDINKGPLNSVVTTEQIAKPAEPVLPPQPPIVFPVMTEPIKPATIKTNTPAPIAKPTKTAHKSDYKIHGVQDNDPFN